MAFIQSYTQIDSPDPVNNADLATKNYVDSKIWNGAAVRGMSIIVGTSVVAPNASGQVAITFATAFPTNCMAVMVSNNDYAGGGSNHVTEVTAYSATGFTYQVHLSTTGAAVTNNQRTGWVAFGY